MARNLNCILKAVGTCLVFKKNIYKYLKRLNVLHFFFLTVFLCGYIFLICFKGQSNV